jgi:hypothetical protein
VYDLDATARIKHEQVDIGAYEFTTGLLACYFSSDATHVLPLAPVHFSSETWGSDASNIVYHWDFENNQIFDMAGTGLAQVVHAYEKEQTYSVLLMATTPGGGTAEYIRTDYITVIPEPTGFIVLLLGIVACIRRIDSASCSGGQIPAGDCACALTR